MRYLDDLLATFVHCQDLQPLLLGGVVPYLFMLADLLHEEIVDHLEQLHMAWQDFPEEVCIPFHGQLLDGALRLKGEALLGDHEGLLEGQAVVVDEEAQKLEDAHRVMHI